MRAAGGILLLLALAACAPQDPTRTEAHNAQLCQSSLVPLQRMRACSAVIADANAPVQDRVAALVARGAMRVEQSQYTRAVADFGRALRLDPSNIEALMQRASIHYDRGAMEAAIRDYDAVLRLYPNHELAAERRQDALAGFVDAFQAQLDQLNRSIADAPGNAMLLNNRCWLRAINNRELDQALADCDASLRIQPNSAATRDSRGLVNLKLEHFEAALADYDAALAIEPGVAHYTYGRGRALLALGREEEGRVAMAQAVAADADIAGIYASYGLP